MVKKTVEGSFAIAEAIKNCEPDVVACYPITSSSHIAEGLAQFYADGEIKEYIRTEQEFSSISAIVGASAAGSRAVSATSSQGLALMHEVVYAAAGMRVPIVMAIGNRALSAPLNIWDDWQDSIAERDSGWIQIYCENAQEAIDTAPQAFKIAEKVMLPVMFCIDGFYITHSVETFEVPGMEEIRKFLPKFNPKLKLDPKNPVSLGVYAMPTHYQMFREDVHRDAAASLKVVKQVHDQYGKTFGRTYGDGLVEGYKLKDARFILVSMASVCGNIKEAVDALRQKGMKVGLLRIRSYRPFPYGQVAKALAKAKAVAVLEKSYNLGGKHPLYSDVIGSFVDEKKRPVISSIVGGLGGKDVTVRDCEGMLKKLAKGKHFEVWW